MRDADSDVEIFYYIQTLLVLIIVLAIICFLVCRRGALFNINIHNKPITVGNVGPEYEKHTRHMIGSPEAADIRNRRPSTRRVNVGSSAVYQRMREERLKQGHQPRIAENEENENKVSKEDGQVQQAAAYTTLPASHVQESLPQKLIDYLKNFKEHLRALRTKKTETPSRFLSADEKVTKEDAHRSYRQHRKEANLICDDPENLELSGWTRERFQTPPDRIQERLPTLHDRKMSEISMDVENVPLTYPGKPEDVTLTLSTDGEDVPQEHLRALGTKKKETPSRFLSADEKVTKEDAHRSYRQHRKEANLICDDPENLELSGWTRERFQTPPDRIQERLPTLHDRKMSEISMDVENVPLAYPGNPEDVTLTLSTDGEDVPQISHDCLPSQTHAAEGEEDDRRNANGEFAQDVQGTPLTHPGKPDDGNLQISAEAEDVTQDIQTTSLDPFEFSVDYRGAHVTAPYGSVIFPSGVVKKKIALTMGVSYVNYSLQEAEGDIFVSPTLIFKSDQEMNFEKDVEIRLDVNYSAADPKDPVQFQIRRTENGITNTIQTVEHRDEERVLFEVTSFCKFCVVAKRDQESLLRRHFYSAINLALPQQEFPRSHILHWHIFDGCADIRENFIVEAAESNFRVIKPPERFTVSWKDLSRSTGGTYDRIKCRMRGDKVSISPPWKTSQHTLDLMGKWNDRIEEHFQFHVSLNEIEQENVVYLRCRINLSRSNKEILEKWVFFDWSSRFPDLSPKIDVYGEHAIGISVAAKAAPSFGQIDRQNQKPTLYPSDVDQSQVSHQYAAEDNSWSPTGVSHFTVNDFPTCPASPQVRQFEIAERRQHGVGFGTFSTHAGQFPARVEQCEASHHPSDSNCHSQFSSLGRVGESRKSTSIDYTGSETRRQAQRPPPTLARKQNLAYPLSGNLLPSQLNENESPLDRFTKHQRIFPQLMQTTGHASSFQAAGYRDGPLQSTQQRVGQSLPRGPQRMLDHPSARQGVSSLQPQPTESCPQEGRNERYTSSSNSYSQPPRFSTGNSVAASADYHQVNLSRNAQTHHAGSSIQPALTGPAHSPEDQAGFLRSKSYYHQQSFPSKDV